MLCSRDFNMTTYSKQSIMEHFFFDDILHRSANTVVHGKNVGKCPYWQHEKARVYDPDHAQGNVPPWNERVSFEGFEEEDH